MPEVKSERSNWRDEGLSARHRLWGWDCPAIDIDFLMLEYDQGLPIALIEYKNEGAVGQNYNHPSYRAIIELGNRAHIPVFIVWYRSDFSQWHIAGLNVIGKRYHPEGTFMSEVEYVAFLYKLRGKELLTEIRLKLKS